VNQNDTDTAELLHVLGYLYTNHGQTQRGLVLLLIAARIAPDHAGILRTLAHALTVSGYGERALAAIERLAALEPDLPPVVQLLRSRALWASGDKLEARRCFREYVDKRGAS
jgi:type III secretion protein Y